MQIPGVVPESERYLQHEDNEGNQLWRVTIMKDYVQDYSRLLKKIGFQNQAFTFDKKAYDENKKLESELKSQMDALNQRIKQTTNFNF